MMLRFSWQPLRMEQLKSKQPMADGSKDKSEINSSAFLREQNGQ